MMLRVRYDQIEKPIAVLTRMENGLQIAAGRGWPQWYEAYGTKEDIENGILGSDMAFLELLEEADRRNHHTEWQSTILSEWGALSSDLGVTDDPTAGPAQNRIGQTTVTVFEARWMYHYRRWAIEDPLTELDRKGFIFLPIYIAWQDAGTGLYAQVSPCNWNPAKPGTVIPWDIDILGRGGESVHQEFSVGIPALSPKRPEGLLRQALRNVLYRCEIPQPVALNIHKFAESLKEV